jgi:hypothetical protein
MVAALAHGADTYTPSSNRLFIPSVVIGNASYSDVVLTVGGVVSGPTGAPAESGQDHYDPATRYLTVPSVVVGSTPYYNVVATVSGLVSIGGVTWADSYDGVDLTIPYVQAGNSTYRNVVITVGSVVHVGSGMPEIPVDSYDSATNVLTIPAVMVGTRVYTNVAITVGKVVSAGGGVTVGGSVTGLASGSTLVLQDNGGDTLSVTANGSFVFPSKLLPGAAYAASIATQPAGQNCVLNNWAGSVGTALVETIAASCVPANAWTWISGPSTADTQGNYGTLGTATPSNLPGARSGATSWHDASGNLWLFAGYADDSTGSFGIINDLWEFNPTSRQWTWVSGAETINAPGVYTLGGSSGMVPGARDSAVAWPSLQGNPPGPVIFGGLESTTVPVCGIGNTCPPVVLAGNDLWTFSPTSLQWTFDGGSTTLSAAGTYGSPGSGSGTTTPGARDGAVAWTDPQGYGWLFGGYGYDGSGNVGVLNDLWVHANGLWIWMGGTSSEGSPGIYGTPGVPGTGNMPGARYGASTWSDAMGNLWLFGGTGLDANGTFGNLNDLWEYTPGIGQWTDVNCVGLGCGWQYTPGIGQWAWISGSSVAGAIGSYGTRNTPSSTNVPGSRTGAVSWSDPSGNLWLFGGSGADSTGGAGLACTTSCDLNDLWTFNPASAQWTWVNGSAVADARGVYGTKGVTATGNAPGARAGAVAWADAAGTFWLFGGVNDDGYGTFGDLWKYAVGPAQARTADKLVAASGMAIGPNGNLYVADTGAVNASGDVRVYRIQRNGFTSAVTGVVEINRITAGISSPVNLAFDASGRLYVVNSGNNSITVYDTNLNQIVDDTITKGVAGPGAVAVDPAGNVYVANDTTNTLSVYQPLPGTGFIEAAFSPISRDAAGNAFADVHSLQYLPVPASSVDGYVGLNALFVASTGNLQVYQTPLPASPPPVSILSGASCGFGQPSAALAVWYDAANPNASLVYVSDGYTINGYSLSSALSGGPYCSTSTTTWHSPSSYIPEAQGLAVDSYGNVFVSTGTGFEVYGGGVLAGAPDYTYSP